MTDMVLWSHAPVVQPPLFILSVATGYGGAERNIEILLPHLPAGRKVVVFACSACHLERLRGVDRPGLEIHRIDASRDGFVEAGARLLVRRYFAPRSSAILANTLDSLRILSHAAAWLPGLDVPSCFYVHDFQWFDHEQLLPAMARATLLVPDRSVLEKPDYLGRHAWPHGPLRALVVPNPVDIPDEAPAPLPHDVPFLHLATVNRFKGHGSLAEAATILRRTCTGVCIDSHGHRPIPALYEDILRHIDAIDAGATLVLREHVPEPAALLRRARAVLATSTSDHGGPETFGRTIIEAWAHGRPVIAFACGAPARLIHHEVDGLLVNEKDAQGLAAAVARLHRDPALAGRLGRNGRTRAEQEFATGVVLQLLLPVLDGQWCRRPAATAANLAEGGPASLFDVSLSLEMGWHAPMGMWRVEPVWLALERNWRLAPHVHIAAELRDEQLLWLYRHARFAVFPSFTEGFGLPVAESLAAGTPVVVSDHPALVEASMGLMPAIDPGDLPAWQREITALCLDDRRLAQLREKALACRVARPDELPRALAEAAGLAA